MSERFVCNSCDQPKHTLEPRKSKVSGVEMLICKTCIDLGFEPRHLLIIAYRSPNEAIHNKAKKYIRNKMYTGNTIELNEVL